MGLLRTMAVEEHENPLVESMEKNEPMTGGKVQTETSASIKDDDASITIDPEGVKTSNRIVDSQQSIRFSLDEAVPPGELHVPPGVDTPFTFGDYFGKYTSKPGAFGVQMNIIQDILAAFYIACCVYMAFAPVKGAPLPISKD